MRGTQNNPSYRAWGGGVAVSRRGFSLIDLLVSIAVMVVLIALLMPSLSAAHESAKRVRCASNVRQIGIAIQAYANDYREALPPALVNDPEHQAAAAGGAARAGQAPQPGTQDTMFVRVLDEHAQGRSQVWNGLGILVENGYLTHHAVFYCPSHHGEHPMTAYADRWVNTPGHIAANYQYRRPEVSPYLSELDPKTSLAADGMRTRRDYNHVRGNNFLRADLSIGWFADLDGSLYQSLPESAASQSGAPGRVPGWQYFDAHDGQ